MNGSTSSTPGHTPSPPVPPVPPVPPDIMTRGRSFSSATLHTTSTRSQPAQPRSHLQEDGVNGHQRQRSAIPPVRPGRANSHMSSNDSSPLLQQGPIGDVYAASIRKSPSASVLYQPMTSPIEPPTQTTFRRPGPVERPQRGSSLSVDASVGTATPVQDPNAPNLVTVGEYALHHLLTTFISAADAKIEKCIAEPSENATNVELVCGPGADQVFDQLIRALGRVGRDRPKALIDAVMAWRRKKIMQGQALAEEQQKFKNKGMTSQRGTLRTRHSNFQVYVNGMTIKASDLAYEIRKAERRSAISVYILCRTLVEIVAQYRPGALSEDTATRLEEIIWSQVRTMDVHNISGSLLKQAHWNIFGQVLGVMSGPRFRSVCDRYMQELASMQSRLSVKGHMDTDTETRAVLLIGNMSWLKIKITPDAAWDQTCELLTSLSSFFANVHGRAIKHAYCQLLEDLLLPIAAKATAQCNSQRWRAMLETLRPKIQEMMMKPKHWVQAFPLLTVTLCVSPADYFSAQWLATATGLQKKLGDRSTRSHSLKALCRLVWRFLYRIHDREALRKLDEVLKMVFQTGKKAILSSDPSVADPLIQLIRIIGYKYQEYCIRNIILPLMNADVILNGKELRIEALEPDRMVIAIRSYLALMADVEKGEQPRFPQIFECDALLDPYSRSPHSHRRSTSYSSVAPPDQLDQPSKPIDVAKLTDSTRACHFTFCKVLSDICIICDNAFGGQAVLDEKLAGSMPKTPLSDSFGLNRRDDLYSPTDVRQSFYDLLHVAVQALPRCTLPQQLHFNQLINLLCTGTAHMQSHIASSSARALKSIARESSIAQQVANGFSNFIFNFDNKYATVADGGLLGAQHIESTLRLYVELVEIWIEQLKAKLDTVTAVAPGSGPVAQQNVADTVKLNTEHPHVDQLEAHGLFFLCSPSRHVRGFAIRVLRLVKKLDQVLGIDAGRMITILEGSSQQVVDVNDESLTTAQRSRLQKGLRHSNVGSTLLELCISDISHDSALWNKVFPGIIRLSQITCPGAVLLARKSVCSRLLQTHYLISQYADSHHDGTFAGRYTSRHALVSEVTIEQWKLHLIYACTTAKNAGNSTKSGTHVRKSSKTVTGDVAKIESADDLFSMIAELLACPNERVRSAAAEGLGTVGPGLHRNLLESLLPYVKACGIDDRSRSETPSRSIHSPRRTKQTDILRTEIAHLYRLTAHCLADEDVAKDTAISDNIGLLLSQLRIFLNHHDVVHQLEHQKLRMHFCGLVEVLYGIWGKESKYFSLKNRITFFTMMESWCGYAPNQSTLTEREDLMRRSLLEATPDSSHRGGMSAAFEKEKKELRSAALSAMAALCAGPVTSAPSEGPTLVQFDIRRMLQWIDTIFNDTPSDKTHATGRRALKNLIMHNPGHTYLLSRSLEMCYFAKSSKTLSSYFDVVTQVLKELEGYDISFWRILCAGLYTLGNEKSDIRMKSARMLRSLEEKAGRNSKLQDLDISVSDRTTAVYKLAQFQVSQRLASQHSDIAFHVFSEFSSYFKDLYPDHQRNMVSAMLPWLQTIELQVNPNNQPTSSSYMLLVNLVEITVRSSNALHHEIQALWQALATGPHGGNVQVVLDFIIAVCLDRGEQNFVDYAKQVVVFLSGTPAGAKVIEFLLLQLTPQSLVVHDLAETLPVPTDTVGLPYMADLNHILPMGEKQSPLSLGQLAMMLMVDLVVSPVQLAHECVPVLLQTIITQWDAYADGVRDQAREMLVHLIHELVISKIDSETTVPSKATIEDLIESIRRLEPRVTWTYEDRGGSSTHGTVTGVPDPMSFVIDEVVRVFSLAFEPVYDIRSEWAKTTLHWATSCPVRHVACRSFQIYRCILQKQDQEMLGSMLSRLSNTIADDQNDYLTFSREILMTLKTIIERLEPVEILNFPQLFWITAACLDTIYEAEFVEALTMLEQLLDRLDLGDPALVNLFKAGQPDTWEGEFEGLHAMTFKGLKSGMCLERCLRISARMLKLLSSALVGAKNRILFTALAYLPVLLHNFENRETAVECHEMVDAIVRAAEHEEMFDIAKAFADYATGSFQNEGEFLSATIKELRDYFFPEYEFSSLVFMIGLLSNSLPWYKIKTMKLLTSILPDVDMSKPQFASLGPDFIAPLLRLLQTNLVQEALNVMDYVMAMTDTEQDREHIRMSMAGGHSSRAKRKEYDKTKSFYGIPEESGWSIPMPALHSARTRRNVQAVVKTCVIGDATSYIAGTPTIEFKEDRLFGNQRVGGTAPTSPVEEPMNELVQKLDSLDDFFDDQDGSETLVGTASQYPSMSIDRESLYDQHTLPILHGSFGRNTSTSSFQNRFDMSPREQVMSPMAFASSSTLNTDYEEIKRAERNRPGTHVRSMTSPMGPTLRTGLSRNDSTFSEDDADSERQDVLSDDDLSLSRTETMEGVYLSVDRHAIAKNPSFRVASMNKLRSLRSNTSIGRSFNARPSIRRMMSASADLPDPTGLQVPVGGEHPLPSPVPRTGPHTSSNSAPPAMNPLGSPPETHERSPVI